ncbi:hypothetical protein CYMTET_52082 [Cymbomonas tetramitiformis]|uniref:Uncharacterized protein n=1 Tax=Cymbomonas tetramitiformis TaxID=36881 RepID=A0AAE0BL14_9CHLO|nr:hypothetical protein CYMTET_52082 [Cymbomonas tetramitiformis]
MSTNDESNDTPPRGGTTRATKASSGTSGAGNRAVGTATGTTDNSDTDRSNEIGKNRTQIGVPAGAGWTGGIAQHTTWGAGVADTGGHVVQYDGDRSFTAVAFANIRSDLEYLLEDEQIDGVGESSEFFACPLLSARHVPKRAKDEFAGVMRFKHLRVVFGVGDEFLKPDGGVRPIIAFEEALRRMPVKVIARMRERVAWAVCSTLWIASGGGGSLSGGAGAGRATYDTLFLLLVRIGLELNVKKSAVFSPLGACGALWDVVDASGDPMPRAVAPLESIRVLGIPVQMDTRVVDPCIKMAIGAGAILPKLNDPPVQIMHRPSTVHASGEGGPPHQLRRGALERDTGIKQRLQEVADSPYLLGEEAVALSQLPTQWGGLGLILAQRLAPASWLGTWAHVWKRLVMMFPLRGEGSVHASGGPGGKATGVYPLVAGLMAAMEDVRGARVKAAEADEHPMLEGFKQAAVETGRCLCGGEVDKFGYHYLASSHRSGMFTNQQHTVQDVLVEMLRNAFDPASVKKTHIYHRSYSPHWRPGITVLNYNGWRRRIIINVRGGRLAVCYIVCEAGEQQSRYRRSASGEDTSEASDFVPEIISATWSTLTLF